MRVLAIPFRFSLPSRRKKISGFRLKGLLLAILVLSGLPAAAGPERAWTARTPEGGPTARQFPAMACDGARQRVLLFGGRASDWTLPGYGDPLADTWEWDGMRWTRRTPSTSPSPRWGHAMTYDSARQRVVLFGGTSGGAGENDLNDTWEWDGEEWVQRAPAVGPPARWNHALAYDSKRGRVALFGGLFGRPFPGPPVLFGDTWEWDGREWVQRTPAISPPARRGHGLAYDSGRDRTVLVGGADGWGSREDTWEWDGSEWVDRMPPRFTLYGRHNIVLVYDTDRQRSVFFGGRAEGWFATTFFYNDILEWDGNAWVYAEWDYAETEVHPSERSDYGLAYDGARRELVLFGGGGTDRTTWVYDVPETGCEGVDDNHNGLVDEGCDDDGDGYCDARMTAAGSPAACPNGGGDCNDGDSSIHPGAADIPGDVLDEDCDGTPACDPRGPWRNHGDFVGCIARECGRLGHGGAFSRQECTVLIQNAAQGAVGH